MYAPHIQRHIDFLEGLPSLYPDTKAEGIRVEGDCVHCLISPPYPLRWVSLGPVTLQSDKQLGLENIRA
jgi:hypothetical protein